MKICCKCSNENYISNPWVILYAMTALISRQSEFFQVTRSTESIFARLARPSIRIFGLCLFYPIKISDILGPNLGIRYGGRSSYDGIRNLDLVSSSKKTCLLCYLVG